MRLFSNHRLAAGLMLMCWMSPSLATECGAQTVWDESVNGDISDDRFNPTSVMLGEGTNSLFATTAFGDYEYFTVTVPESMQLSQIILASYQSSDPLGFIGIQSGSTFTESPEEPEVGNLLGWTHFGWGNNTAGTDILDNMGAGFGAIGFTPPLPSGQYTFWIQQWSPDSMTYQLDFVVAPAAPSLAILVFAGVVQRRRRRSP